MIHPSFGASRRAARIIGTLGAPLLAIVAGILPNPASAGSAIALDSQPPPRGSYCGGSSDDAGAPVRTGCARISGYIAAGERFGSDERIGGRHDPFEPINGNPVSGFTIVGAPLNGDRFLAPTSSGDTAR